jgi:3-dehydroquinate synthase
MTTLHVPLSQTPYDIVFTAALAGEAVPGLSAQVGGKDCLLISDSTVAPLYGERAAALLQGAGAARVTTTVFPAGEASKHLGTLAELYAAAVGAGLDRGGVMVALGGGVVGDLAGFCAASYMRGIPYVQLPTTLLAQVDSAVGGKTGLDLPQGKNLVGAFHQPAQVVVDVATLCTLPPRQLACGLAEVVKYGVIMDAELFSWLEARVAPLLALDEAVYREVVYRCCALKARVVVADERELTGQRAILNYGHTFGHALEQLTGYARYTHGEAIAIGMGMAVDLARRLADSPALADLQRRQDALLAALGLPLRAAGLAPAAIQQAMRQDKKYQQGRNRLILPDRIGLVRLVKDTDEALIRAAIEGRCDP